MKVQPHFVEFAIVAFTLFMYTHSTVASCTVAEAAPTLFYYLASPNTVSLSLILLFYYYYYYASSSSHIQQQQQQQT